MFAIPGKEQHGRCYNSVHGGRCYNSVHNLEICGRFVSHNWRGFLCSRLLLRHVIWEIGLWRLPCLPIGLFNHGVPHRVGRGNSSFRGSPRCRGSSDLYYDSVLLEKYLPQKSDAFTITSYCSFALMSLSLSRKLALGFETGFSAFFLQLFASQLFKIKWFLFPIALVFCSVIIILRHDSETGVQFLHHYSESGVQFLRHYLELGVQFFRHNPEPEVQEVGSIPSNNGSDPPPNSVAIDIEGQHSPQRRLLPPNNQQPNDQVPAGQHSPQQRLLPPNNQQPNDQVPTEQERVSSGNNQNGRMPDSAGAGLFPPAPPGLRWRRPRMPTGIVLYFWNSYHSKSRWSHA